MIYPYYGTLFSNRKGWTIHTHIQWTVHSWAAWMNLQKIILFEKKNPVTKNYMLYDSIYITFMKLQNYGNREQMIGCLELRRGWGKKKVIVAIKEHHNGSLWWWKYSILWLYCQYSGCDIIILKDMIIGGNCVKSARNLVVLFLTLSNITKIISK